MFPGQFLHNRTGSPLSESEKKHMRRRSTPLRIVLLSVVACLVFVLGVVLSTDTASAHSTAAQSSASAQTANGGCDFEFDNCFNRCDFEFDNCFNRCDFEFGNCFNRCDFEFDNCFNRCDFEFDNCRFNNCDFFNEEDESSDCGVFFFHHHHHRHHRDCDGDFDSDC